MSQIFISYRREDSAPYAGRLSDHLGQHFGQDNIFMDIDTLKPGVDFVEAIEKAVGSCQVLIALIGRQWLTITDSQGQQRLNDPQDFVRLEIKTALDRNIRVIPALIGGATMPQSMDLPNGLKKLARRNAIEISDTRFREDVDRLINAMDEVLGVPRPTPRRLPKGLIAGIGVSVLAGRSSLRLLSSLYLKLEKYAVLFLGPYTPTDPLLTPCLRSWITKAGFGSLFKNTRACVPEISILMWFHWFG